VIFLGLGGLWRAVEGYGGLWMAVEGLVDLHGEIIAP